ncbi:methyltransferase domain-containing protein [Chlorobium sp. N1]|uniref:methyltransferase domain-containing protein n=1 Tax=Chlorobium sp. N1 TaxID=2491138 RepID=UPI001040B74A|nr:methyltransferase domain-containing protein [Chlorobium sp. N1]TCD48797.1 methyltransferase domain-containing protein [Chlorobium sp. N1]
MLQQKTAAYQAIERLRRSGRFPSGEERTERLKEEADRFIAEMRRERTAAARELGGIFHLQEFFDGTLRTDERELMDSPDLPEDRKLRMARALERQSGMLQLNRRFVALLSPLIRELARGSGRETRVLELAAGAGGLSLALGRETRDRGLPCRVTGTDIVAAYVEASSREAEREGLEVRFRTLDACRAEEIESEPADLVLVAQSLHHFSPGELALMVRGAREAGARAFVGIDGYRSPLVAAGVPLVAALQGIAEFALDGLTSARKFYSEAELDAVIEIATGERNHLVLNRWPLTLVLARFDGVRAEETEIPLA